MRAGSALVSPAWVHARRASLRLLDASWYLPGANRSPAREFVEVGHLPGAQFFDLDEVVTPSDLPHMMPSAEVFEEAMCARGISNTSTVVVYDTHGLFSSARMWFTLRYFGHERALVLNGGQPAWVASGYPLEKMVAPVERGSFRATVAHPEQVVALEEMRRVIRDGRTRVVDARPADRFAGTAPEPRPARAMGHMPGALNVPFTSLRQATPAGYNVLASHDALRATLRPILASDAPVVTSCGSGMSACLVNLALHELGHQGPVRLYDGSWAEWGNVAPPEDVATGPSHQ